jgi:hypothetical protein
MCGYDWYRETNRNLLRETFDTSARIDNLPLWEYLDSIIEEGIHDRGSMICQGTVYESVQMFCTHANIQLPPLYEYLANLDKQCPLAAAKAVISMRDYWLERFAVKRYAGTNEGVQLGVAAPQGGILAEYAHFLKMTDNDKGYYERDNYYRLLNYILGDGKYDLLDLQQNFVQCCQ